MSDDVKYIYVRNEKGFPVGCLAYVFKFPEHENISSFLPVCLEYAYSLYNSKDKFNKNIARLVAAGRLAKRPKAAWFTPTIHVNDMLASVLKETAHTEIHQWAFDEDGVQKGLPMAFRSACSFTSEAFKNAKQKAA